MEFQRIDPNTPITPSAARTTYVALRRMMALMTLYVAGFVWAAGAPAWLICAALAFLISYGLLLQHIRQGVSKRVVDPGTRELSV
jgi:hypothetical protein